MRENFWSLSVRWVVYFPFPSRVRIARWCEVCIVVCVTRHISVAYHSEVGPEMQFGVQNQREIVLMWFCRQFHQPGGDNAAERDVLRLLPTQHNKTQKGGRDKFRQYLLVAKPGISSCHLRTVSFGKSLG